MEIVLMLTVGVVAALVILWAVRALFGGPTARGAPNANAPKAAPRRSPDDTAPPERTDHTAKRRHVDD